MTPEEAVSVSRGEALQAVAARLRSGASGISDAGYQVRREAARELAGGGWLGAAAIAAHQAHGRHATAIEELAAAVGSAAAALAVLGAAVTTAGRDKAAVLAEAEKYGWRLIGGHLVPKDFAAPPTFGRELPQRLCTILAGAAAADRTAAVALRAVAADLRRLTSRWGPADLVDPVQAVLLARAGALGAVSTTDALAVSRLCDLVTSGDPVRIRAYLDSLSPAERAALVDGHPELIGPVDGAPPVMRYAANRKILIRELAGARSRADDSMVLRLAAWLRDAARQFLLVDIPGGRIAEVIGNLDTAKHVGVYVPGIRSSLGNFDEMAADAANLWNQATELAAESVAMVSWLGYRTPDLAQAPGDEIAIAGAPALRDLIAGLLLRKKVTTTVVAHSYGSLLAGFALRDGLRIDSLVTLGSPGMGVNSATELHLPAGTRIFAARAPGDAVGWSEAFGRDPANSRFGATRIATGTPGQGGPTGHTAYLHGATEITRNLALILVGRFAQVTRRDADRMERVADSLNVSRGLSERAARAEVAAISTIVDHLPDSLGEPLAEDNELAVRLGMVLNRLTDLDLYSQIDDDLWEMEGEWDR